MRLVFLSSVYKEIDSRVAFMKKVHNALKDTGRLAILEYRMNERSPGPPQKYRLAEQQVTAELEAAASTRRTV